MRQGYYSVPARYVGRLPVRLSANRSEVLDGARVVARHARARSGSRGSGLGPLPGGAQAKPGALPGATALTQARASAGVHRAHQRFWDAARRKRGDGAGTRALIEMLLLHRTLPAAAVLAG